MKIFFIKCFFLFWFQFSWSQKKDSFSYTNVKLNEVLTEIENVFDVKYSYVDSLVNSKRFSLSLSLYNLIEINAEIEKQLNLKVVKINDRYYSLKQIEANESSQKIILLDEIIVEDFLAKGIQKTNQNYIIYPQKIQTLPGISDADILQSLQQLPGVISPNETATGLNIRGGTADQNLIIIDGIRLYHPGHLFGMITSINTNLDQTVNFYNKAVNPKFGERVSGIIDIKSTDKITDKTKFKVGINALNFDASLQIPLVKEKLGLQISGRKSYTELLQTPTFKSLEAKVFQNINLNDFDKNNQFQFYDYSGKLNFKPNSKTEISLSGLMIKNNLDYRNEINKDSLNNQRMIIENYGFSLNWLQKYSPKFTQKTVLFYSLYSFDYLKKTDYDVNKFEAFKKLNRIVDSGGELNFYYQINDQSKLESGYQIFGNDISHLFNSFNQDIGVVLSLRQLYNITQVGYINLNQDFGSWNIQTGLRNNFYSKQKASSFEPRLMLQKTFLKSFIWNASFEKRSQVLSQARENATNDLSLENYVWVLSDNNNYPIQRANQFTTGIIIKKNHWLIDVETYYKNITGITSFSLDLLTQMNNEIQHGNGFTKGVDVLIQKNTASWRTWVTYTYQDSQNQFKTLNNGNYFSSNASIKHSLNLAFNRRWNNFLFTTGWFWHSGKPFSQINNLGEIISFNSQRLPNYHRLDISGSYEFQNKIGDKFKIGLSVYNLYNRSVLISKELERKYTNLSDFDKPRYEIQNFYSLGIMPNIFFRVNF